MLGNHSQEVFVLEIFIFFSTGDDFLAVFDQEDGWDALELDELTLLVGVGGSVLLLLNDTFHDLHTLGNLVDNQFLNILLCPVAVDAPCFPRGNFSRCEDNDCVLLIESF